MDQDFRSTAIVTLSHARLTRRSLGSHDSASVTSDTSDASDTSNKNIPVLENYEVIKSLGVGAFSDVYLAQVRWQNPNSLVALKTLPISHYPTAVNEVEILEVKKLDIYAYEYLC